jgi:two-component sensor histidine kinase
MLRNIHHRIEHNLDDVSGLLLRHLAAHPQTWEVIEEAIGQFNAIAIVHGLESKSQGRDLKLEEMVSAIRRSVKNAATPQLATGLAAKVRVTDSEAVPLALILKVLILNAVSHGSGPGRIELDGDAAGVSVRIVNPSLGGLPAGLDFSSGTGLGVGLSLVKALLPPAGAHFSLRQQGGEVLAELTLAQPVISTV